MKNRKGVARCDLDQVPVTFLDVAAYFSEEEWKLLHDWQKDLYKNVMKEIQQALVSLGPLIANSVFSLRPKEKDHHCPVDNLDPEITGHVNISPNLTADSEVVFNKIKKVHPDLKTVQNSNQRVRCDVPSTGNHIFNSDRIPRTDNEICSSVMDHFDSEESKSRASTGLETAPVISFTIKSEEEEMCFINRLDHLDSERKESITNTTRPEVTVPVAPFGINEDRVTYPLDIQDYGRRESMKSPTGAGTMEKKWKNENPVKFSKKALQCEATLGNSKAKAIQRSEKNNDCRSLPWSELNWKKGETATQCANNVMNDAQSSLYQAIPNAPIAVQKEESVSRLWNVQDFIGQENRQNKWGLFNFLEGEKSFRQHSSVAEHRQSQEADPSLKVRCFSCAECKKSFIQKIHLIRHQRTHSGEKPYHCSECEKSFSHKHILIGHQRKHSGERPFQCTQCMKSFSWKEGLRRHQRTHTGHT